MAALYGPPLCPAGHLPLKGGDQTSSRLSPISDAPGEEPAAQLLISPLEGEMAGRPEGRASRRLSLLAWRP
ncbi:lytic murein transglycosylase [Mesorhizobium sp. B2-7-2]|nr:lytic murein transglycosylase [Mesorhizobium sp. B2-7-2]